MQPYLWVEVLVEVVDEAPPAVVVGVHSRRQHGHQGPADPSLIDQGDQVLNDLIQSQHAWGENKQEILLSQYWQLNYFIQK